MLHNLWHKLTGWHAYKLQEEDSYRAIFFTQERDAATTYDRPHFSVEIPFKPKLQAGFEFSLGGEDADFGGYLSLGYRIYFHVNRVLPRAFRQKMITWMGKNIRHPGDSRTIRLEVRSNEDGDELYFVADLWRDDSCWNHDDNVKAPWNGNGWHYMKDLKELVLGKTLYQESGNPEDTKVERIWIQMPEGSYPALMTTTRVAWKRQLRAKLERLFPDIFQSEMLYRVNVKLPQGISSPGKGENSWDLDDNRMDETSLGATKTTMHRSVVSKKVSESVMRDRFRHGGGYAFVPDDGWPSYLIPHGKPRVFPEGFGVREGAEVEE